jgi:hypothetical protein
VRKLPLLLALTALLALPPHASAQGPESGIDQYQENVPAAGGDRPSDGGEAGSGGSGGTVDPAPAAPAPAPAPAPVEDPGAVAPTDTAPAEATAPSAGSASAEGDAARGGSGKKQDEEISVTAAYEKGASFEAPSLEAASDEQSGPAKVLDALVGGLGGGMGIALPIILGGSLLAALLSLVARRRRGGEHASST